MIVALLTVGIMIGASGAWLSLRADLRTMNRAFLDACERADLARSYPDFLGVSGSDLAVIECLAKVRAELHGVSGTLGNVDRVRLAIRESLRAIDAVRRPRK